MTFTDVNEHGEVVGAGAPWACGRFGLAGHNYHKCPHCKAEFYRYLAVRRGEQEAPLSVEQPAAC